MTTSIQPTVDIIPRSFPGNRDCAAVVTVTNSNLASALNLEKGDWFDFEFDAHFGGSLKVSSSVVVNSPSGRLDRLDFQLSASHRSARVTFVGQPCLLAAGEGFGFAVVFRAPPGLAVATITATNQTSRRVDLIAPPFTVVAFTADRDDAVAREHIDISRTTNVTGGSTNVTGGSTNVTGGSTNITGGNTNITGGNTNISGGNTTLDGGNANVSGGATTVVSGNTTITGGTVVLDKGATVTVGPGGVLNVTNVTTGSAGPIADIPAGPNFLQVAAGRWYDAAKVQQVALPGLPFNGSAGGALVFDGRSVWVAAFSADSLHRVDPTTGVVSEIALANGSSLGTVEAMVHDGEKFWISGSSGGLIVSPTGDLVADSLPGCRRGSMLFDGTSVWSGLGRYLTRLGAAGPWPISSGQPLTIDLGVDIQGLMFDGRDIWIAASTGNSGGRLLGLRPADQRASIPLDLGFRPSAIAFDRRDLWIACEQSNAVYRFVYDSTGEVWIQTASHPAGFRPFALLFDGANMWVANHGQTVTKLRVSDGELIETVSLSHPPTGGMAFDGINVWVALVNGTVRRL